MQEIYGLFELAQVCNCTVFELAERIYDKGEYWWRTFATEALQARNQIQWEAERRRALGIK